MCLVKMPVYTLDEVLKGDNPLCVILEDLQDPGNVGTIFRTAEGAGVTGILLSRNTVDLFNPKTIRSTMGSIYRMPFLYVEDLCEILPGGKRVSIRMLLIFGERMPTTAKIIGEDRIFVGNEGNGLSERLSSRADSFIKIPMEGKVESLNAAIASSILMYEAYRQRR